MSATALPSVHGVRLAIAGAGSVAPLAVGAIARAGGTIDTTRRPGDGRGELVNIAYAERFVTKDGPVWTLTDLGWCVYIVSQHGRMDTSGAPEHVVAHMAEQYRRVNAYYAAKGFSAPNDDVLTAWEQEQVRS